MNVVDKIIGLLGEFAALGPEAIVEPGPFHPDSRPELAGVLAAWLKAYPALAADLGYVAFLEQCSVACVFPAEQPAIELAGVFQFEGEIEGRGFREVKDGWYTIGWSRVGHHQPHQSIYFGFYFNLLGQAPWGVYLDTNAADRRSNLRRVADNFSDFLRQAIDLKGDFRTLADPGSEFLQSCPGRD